MPRLLDLFCCAGGAAMGYARAGFDVVGVDINDQPHYPFEFHKADALEYLADHWQEFDAIHASPPCQMFTAAQNIAKNTAAHLDLLTPTRTALQEIGLPYIIENVPGAPMRNYITLCGSEFGLIAPDVDGVMLQLRRHRQFESNLWLTGRGGCRHIPGMDIGSVFGHGGGWRPAFRDSTARTGGYTPHRKVCAQLLGIDWPMKPREMSEAIPPAYTEFLGRQLIDWIEVAA